MEQKVTLEQKLAKYEPKLVTVVTSAFNTFDQDGSGKVAVLEMANVIRSLGIYATEAEIRQYILEMQNDGADVYIYKDSFIPYMCDLIAQEKHEGPSYEELEQAFALLDPDNSGYLDENNLRTQLQSQGEKMTADEVETLIQFAKDAETGMIDWRAYLRTTIDILWKGM